MRYQAALDYIQGFTDYEKKPALLYASSNFDLRRMEELLGRLGNPHLLSRSVHVAGSKGKGSTAAMIASSLHAAGYRTGLYTSPHLHTFRERIRVDGDEIKKGEFSSLVERLRPDIEAVNRESAYGQLTTFEILTAMAFAYFRDRKVDFQVLEVGLGGRLDATNVVKPDVSVITSISLDHTAVLGDSIARIAGEKAGIIKRGVTVISSPQREEAARVIEDSSREKSAKLVMVGRDVTWEGGASGLWGQSFRVMGRTSHDLTIPLIGDHQLENAATAVAALEELGVSSHDIASGLSRVRWQGRMEILRREPVFVVDGAHNRDSARRLVQTMERYFRFERSILIIGTSYDKDIRGIAGELQSFDEVIVTRSRHPRAVEPRVILAEFQRLGVKTKVSESVSLAASQALEMAGRDDLVLATGSLFVCAEAIEYIKGFRPEEALRR